MVQYLFVILLFTGLVPPVLSVPHSYYFIPTPKTWSQALSFCTASQYQLAIVANDDDLVQLQYEIQTRQFNQSAWIGLISDITSWRWSYGNQPLGMYSRWSIGQPDNKGGNQYCVVMDANGWNDLPCTNRYPFLCINATATITVYKYIAKNVTWPEAWVYCKTFYTDLATVRTASQNTALNYVISGYTWVGLFREGWVWTDQTMFSTISWMHGHPDNALGNENCAYIHNGQAADAQCTDVMPFFCFSVTRKQQQIVKLMVRSKQDVNNPTLMMAILEQINQKLKDHGLVLYMSVKWRKQPDGKVFHTEKNK